MQTLPLKSWRRIRRLVRKNPPPNGVRESHGHILTLLLLKETNARDLDTEDPATEESAPEKNSIKEANAEGQLSDTVDEIRIQASAKHMTFASSFFKKALLGGWKESESYLQNGSVEVIAEDWDCDALLIVLRAIHCQFLEIPNEVTLEMLAKIAVVANYYDCK